jgi:hypothetical protein
MLTPFIGFHEREIIGVYVVGAPANSGLGMTLSTADATPIVATPYGNSFGTIVPATTNTAASGVGATFREQGYLLQPVTASGPSVFSILSSIYDESVPEGEVAGVVSPKAGAQIATDQYVASGSGAILFDGSVALLTQCSLNAGMVRTNQTNDVSRLLFLGQTVQRVQSGVAPLAVFQIL